MDSAHVDDVPLRYAEFAQYEVRDRTPVYLAWARGVADDPATCELIASLPRIKRQPVLVFAAARHVGAPETEDYAEFRDFLHARWDEVAHVARTHSTQTNEAKRCAVLLPFLAMLRRPLSLIEVGAAAGLCLYPDRYAYRYTLDDGEVRDLRPSSVAAAGVERTPVLGCSLRDGIPVPAALPEVLHRGGVDLAPIDPADPESRAWLRSLVWPGQQAERVPRLDAALDIASADPPHVLQGDLVDRVADAVDAARAAAPDATPVVFHTAVLGYLESPARAEFVRRVQTLVRNAGAVWISVEGVTLLPDVASQVPAAIRRHKGIFVVAVNGRPLATAHGHGDWVRALEPD